MLGVRVCRRKTTGDDDDDDADRCAFTVASTRMSCVCSESTCSSRIPTKKSEKPNSREQCLFLKTRPTPLFDIFVKRKLKFKKTIVISHIPLQRAQSSIDRIAERGVARAHRHPTECSIQSVHRMNDHVHSVCPLHFLCRCLIACIMLRCPLEYCSSTSRTS